MVSEGISIHACDKHVRFNTPLGDCLRTLPPFCHSRWYLAPGLRSKSHSPNQPQLTCNPCTWREDLDLLPTWPALINSKASELKVCCCFLTLHRGQQHSLANLKGKTYTNDLFPQLSRVSCDLYFVDSCVYLLSCTRDTKGRLALLTYTPLTDVCVVHWVRAALWRQTEVSTRRTRTHIHICM